MKNLSCVYSVLLSVLLVLSVKNPWLPISIIFCVIWVFGCLLARSGSEFGVKLTRLCLCVVLGVGITALVASSLLLFRGGLDSPMSEVIGLIYTQIVFSIPALFLLLRGEKPGSIENT